MMKVWKPSAIVKHFLNHVPQKKRTICKKGTLRKVRIQMKLAELGEHENFPYNLQLCLNTKPSWMRTLRSTAVHLYCKLISRLVQHKIRYYPTKKYFMNHNTAILFQFGLYDLHSDLKDDLDLNQGIKIGGEM